MKNFGNNYVGKAGQLAVMSELCLRGYNVAMPEIDIGDDVFVVNDDSGAYQRIQVKTSNARPQQNSKAYHFRVRKSAISKSLNPELYFIFVMRWDSIWRYAIIERTVLNNYVITHHLGSDSDGEYRRINMTLSNDGTLTGHGLSLTHHLDQWGTWPAIARNSRSGGTP